MANLEVEFGRDRVIDSPVSELLCTGAAGWVPPSLDGGRL